MRKECYGNERDSSGVPLHHRFIRALFPLHERREDFTQYRGGFRDGCSWRSSILGEPWLKQGWGGARTFFTCLSGCPWERTKPPSPKFLAPLHPLHPPMSLYEAGLPSNSGYSLIILSHSHLSESLAEHLVQKIHLNSLVTLQVLE